MQIVLALSGVNLAFVEALNVLYFGEYKEGGYGA